MLKSTALLLSQFSNITDKLYNISDIASELSMVPRYLNLHLSKLGLQNKIDDEWELNEPYKSKELYLKVKIQRIKDDGVLYFQHKYTELGRKLILNLLQK